jgi:type IV pilus biogenesis protein CpaD/CtpE
MLTHRIRSVLAALVVSSTATCYSFTPDDYLTRLTTTRDQRPRVLRRWRSVSATLFAAAMAMCFVPTGCAVSDEHVEALPQPSEQAQPLVRSLDPGVENTIRACVKEGVSRLK